MRLVVCCDGTWNTPNQLDGDTPAPTNVYKFFTAVSKNSEQKTYYRSGVGTSGSLLKRLSGGAFGSGIDDDIKSPYKWLCENYDKNRLDEIFLVGFSRGAYTVRSLAGLIGRFGLLELRGSNLDEGQRWSLVSQVYGAYRETNRAPTNAPRNEEVKIRFLGVFDTVGALGIPPDLNFTRRLFNRKKYQFHDTVLGGNVETACHAVAMDERRLSFTPTLWTNVDRRPHVKQMWFPGVHGDVGGSYAETGLGDIALDWMIDAAIQCKLDFQDRFRDQLKPNCQGILHDSVKGGFEYMRTQPRAVPNHRIDRNVHNSARRRAAKPPISQSEYWPTTGIKNDMQITRPIRAKEQWSPTGIFLEKGKMYEFSARGEWLDKKTKSGPGGFSTSVFSPGHAVSAAIGQVKRAFSAQLRIKSNDAILSRRQDQWPWFALVGMVANGVREGRSGLPDEKDPTPPTHQSFLIGDKVVTFSPASSGYLYCYANDAWHFYSNNRGKVWLTVKLAC